MNPNQPTSAELDAMLYRGPAEADATTSVASPADQSLLAAFAHLRAANDRLIDQQWHSAARAATQRRRNYWFAATAAVALPLAVLMTVLPMRTHPVQAPAPVNNVAASQAISDNALLESVDSDLSFTLPAALEPLAPATTSSSSRKE